jgi:hypothetical protein
MPHIAARISAEHDKWWMTYVIPSSEAAADAWATDTIFWYDDEMSTTDRLEMLACRHWKSSDNVLGLELHVSPISISQSIWMFR